MIYCINNTVSISSDPVAHTLAHTAMGIFRTEFS